VVVDDDDDDLILGGFRRVVIGVVRLLREPTIPCQMCDPCTIVVTTTASMFAFSEDLSFFRLSRPPTSIINMAFSSWGPGPFDRLLPPPFLLALLSLHQHGS
jgi:hypothetical protein